MRFCAEYVVVGLGTAGAVLARELAEAGHTVLVLEMGPNLSSDPWVQLSTQSQEAGVMLQQLSMNQKYARHST
jgi:choline dehydrogenase-like flavoprotein